MFQSTVDKTLRRDDNSSGAIDCACHTHLVGHVEYVPDLQCAGVSGKPPCVAAGGAILHVCVPIKDRMEQVCTL